MGYYTNIQSRNDLLVSYTNDIFISYRREKYMWTPWTRDDFKRSLEGCLQRELGRPATVFIDEKVPLGSDYVEYLATTLASTRVMVALLSRDYFSSDWCVHELDLMMERSAGNDIIIPIVVHDGEIIPDAVGKIQRADFKKYANPALSHAGPLFAEFFDAVKELAEGVGKAVTDAPAYDEKWTDHFRQRLTEVYRASKAGNRIAPKSFILKELRPSITPFRLSP
jgi:hypothetical protein